MNSCSVGWLVCLWRTKTPSGILFVVELFSCWMLTADWNLAVYSLPQRKTQRTAFCHSECREESHRERKRFIALLWMTKDDATIQQPTPAGQQTFCRDLFFVFRFLIVYVWQKNVFFAGRITTNENMKHRHSFVGQGYMLPFVLITFFFFSIVILS